jgi:hypothetical protein
MKKPMIARATGLGHPEGPYELERRTGDLRQHLCQRDRLLGPEDQPPRAPMPSSAAVPNACMLGSDGAVYSTQTPNVGAWVAPEYRPPSIQKTKPDGTVEILVTEADGVKFDGPNDLTFGPDGRLYFHRFRRLEPGRETASRPHRRHRARRRRQDPRRARPRLSERHRRRAGRLDRLGGILHAARRQAAGPTAPRRSSTRLPRVTSPTA